MALGTVAPKPSSAGGTLRDDEHDGYLTSSIIASMDFCSASECDRFGSGGERRKPANALDSSADLSREFRKRCAGMLESRKLCRATREENS